MPEAIAAAKEKGALLIAFPEMTLTGFTMRPELFAEPEENSDTENFFLKLSAEYKIAILFGRIEKRQDGYYNLLEIADQDRIIFKIPQDSSIFPTVGNPCIISPAVRL